MPKHTPNTLWPRVENAFLVLLLACKAMLLWKAIGETIGFDAGAHLEMLDFFAWSQPYGDIRAHFYSYHPPLGFLLPRTLTFLGFSSVVSVQLVSFGASLLAFFLLRATLRALGLLHHPGAIAFLYLSASIPVQTYLSTSVNLDVLIMALAAAALHCSVRLFWLREDGPDRFLLGAGLVTALSCAMLTKFSGLILVAIPVLVALAAADRGFLRRTAVAGALAGFALTVVAPYYYTRYYVHEGKFLVSNTDFFIPAEMEEARQKRDSDPLRFFVELVLPAPVHAAKGPVERDWEVLRLADTWRDLWMKDAYLGPMAPGAQPLGAAYLLVAPWLVIGGWLLLLHRTMRRWGTWERLGWVLAVFGALEVAAMVHFLYSQPFPGWGPTKGIYIAPACLALAYLLAQLVPGREGGLPRLAASLQAATLGVVAAFMTANHLLPVY